MTLRLRDFPQSDPTASSAGPTRTALDGEHRGSRPGLRPSATVAIRAPKCNRSVTPIAGLERHLHRLQGDARLALRAVREAVLESNREGRTA